MITPVMEKTRTPIVTVTVWSREMVRYGPIRGVLSVSMAPRWNAAGSASFTVRSDDRMIKRLRELGSRVLVEYWADRDDAEATLAISGLAIEEEGSPRTGRVTGITFTVEDDWIDVFQHTLGWVAPTQPITNQGAETAYYKKSGPAETVAKDIVQKNCTRVGKALVVPASAGRGSAITVQIRMHPLADRLFPAVDGAGIGLQVLQVGSSRQLITHTRTTYTETLTDVTGAVIEGSYEMHAPTVTRVVCGASGKQEARIFRHFIDSEREALWGMKIEEFLDCRDVEYPSTGFEAEVAARAQERLDEGAETVGIEAKLQESARWWVGRDIRLGTTVTVQLGDGPVVSDLVREIQVETTPAGVRVTPLVGPWDETGTAKTFRLLAAIGRRTRDLGVE